ncbi:hypothetical protein PVK06_034801 [Gossypium arboreum]|uniref:RNase H type-1 domain-containing protein n=1 Tax=Gossypium arboreum TaxID=29729 RepID=A0ABR0NFQ8_GOSAR|nr:hypothetical protein PVK06_034801 [Gossypium arboreum]
MVCCGIWLIWNLRNRLVHERKTETARELSQRIQSYMAELTVEAYAGLQAVKLGISLDLRSVMIRGDSRSVIKKWQSQEQDKSVIGAIISDTQSKKAWFHEIRFQIINKTNNVHAHKVAEESLKKREETYQLRANLDLFHLNPEGRWRICPD